MRNKVSRNSVTVTKPVSFSGYVRGFLTHDVLRLTKRASLPINAKRGFTLIELLVVMAVIAILATVGLTVYPQAQKQARDNQRKSDLRQYQAALESYANANGGIFPSNPGNPAPSLCSIAAIDLDGKGFIASCQDDSVFTIATEKYRYDSDGSGGGTATATRYFVYAKLESVTNTYYVMCSNGKVGPHTGAPPNNSGACPI